VECTSGIFIIAHSIPCFFCYFGSIIINLSSKPCFLGHFFVNVYVDGNSKLSLAKIISCYVTDGYMLRVNFFLFFLPSGSINCTITRASVLADIVAVNIGSDIC